MRVTLSFRCFPSPTVTCMLNQHMFEKEYDIVCLGMLQHAGLNPILQLQITTPSGCSYQARLFLSCIFVHLFTLSKKIPLFHLIASPPTSPLPRLTCLSLSRFWSESFRPETSLHRCWQRCCVFPAFQHLLFFEFSFLVWKYFEFMLVDHLKTIFASLYHLTVLKQSTQLTILGVIMWSIKP